MSEELARRHEALTTQFHALATVASQNLPHYMKRAASSGVTAAGGAAAGVVQAYFGVRAGTAINAGVAAASLVAGLFFHEKPDVAELGHAVARGVGAGAISLASYNGMADWLASRPQTKILPAPVANAV